MGSGEVGAVEGAWSSARALGNEVLKNLALLGVGTACIVDFDKIEESNLTRSVLFRARDCGRSQGRGRGRSAARYQSGDARLRPMHGNVITDVGLGLFRDVDVVIGCLDNREARLWVNRQCWKVGTPWIDAGIQEINGVVKVFTPPDARLLRMRHDRERLPADQPALQLPAAPPRRHSRGQGAHRADDRLDDRRPAGAGGAEADPRHAGRRRLGPGLQRRDESVLQHGFQRNDDCLSHETYPEPIELPLKASETTARELFAAVRERSKTSGPLRLELERDLVVSLVNAGGEHRRVMRSLQNVGMREATDETTGETLRPHLEHSVAENSPLADELLSDLGIPAYDIVRVNSASGEQVYLLNGDKLS